METMKKIKNVKEALELFESAAMERSEALKMSNSKKANRNYDKMAIIVKYLRENKSLHELAVFYQHPDICLRSSAAAYLLPLYEEKSIDVLQEIAEMKGIEGFNAEMTIKEWKKGNLHDFYTL